MPQTISLTETDIQSMRELAEANGECLVQLNSGWLHQRLPPSLGDGGDRSIALRDGLSISVREGQIEQTLRVTCCHDANFPLVAKFYLAGRSRVQTLNAREIQSDYVETNGCHYFYYLPQLTEIEEWPGNDACRVVYIIVDPGYFEQFAIDATGLPCLLKQLFEGRATRFHQPLGCISPEMHRVLEQILRCPYNGAMQQLYLESKALELLTLQFAVLADRLPQHDELRLRSCEIARLHHARDIIQARIDRPPSLPELSRCVGLNERKLKQGFRQLFDTTVFGYLRTYRLQRAKQLLCDTNCTVAQVALEVGYTNPEAFSTAFRRQFSVSPKAYQLDCYG